MKFIVCENYEEMSKAGADIVISQLKEKKNSILGLATGSTPIGLYKELIKAYENGEISFKDVKTFNLDEYYPIYKSNDQSYDYFMNDNLFSHIDIDKANTDIPNGEAVDAVKECADYEKRIAASEGVDIQILGIGQNGHIGFNEPDSFLYSDTHVTGLTDSTMQANARFFSEDEVMPTKALTMGMGSIFKARKIIVMANGKAKRDAVRKLISGKITTECPVTFLNLHSDVTLICDKLAIED